MASTCPARRIPAEAIDGCSAHRVWDPLRPLQRSDAAGRRRRDLLRVGMFAVRRAPLRATAEPYPAGCCSPVAPAAGPARPPPARVLPAVAAPPGDASRIT